MSSIFTSSSSYVWDLMKSYSMPVLLYGTAATRPDKCTGTSNAFHGLIQLAVCTVFQTNEKVNVDSF